MRVVPTALAILLAAGVSVPAATAQQPAHKKGQPPPVTFTADQDHQNMMDQLGIEALRPGPSGDPKAPDHANYDESKANPYPNYPKALTLKDGQKVTTAAKWWNQRRPQIVHDYSEYVYGFVPKNVPKVTWKVVATDHEHVGFHPVLAKELIGHVDDSSYPAIQVNIRMTVVTPADVKGPVPVLMMFGRAGFPAPNEPSPEEMDQINAAMKKLLIGEDPSLKKVFEGHQAWEPETLPPFQFPKFNADGDPPETWELIDAGWGYATLDPQSVQADDGAGITRGIIGLVNQGQPRKPDQWGALRAWAWGASRALDYFATDKAVDAKRVAIAGHSRYGKAALVAMAYDQRFAAGYISSSGEGGAKLYRHIYGEGVGNLASDELYWMAGDFMRYDGPLTVNDLPVDANELIALCAPRAVFVSGGATAAGDGWVDAKGMFIAEANASPVYRLLGVKGLGTNVFPPMLTPLTSGALAFRQHNEGHTPEPNWPYFLNWAARWMNEPGK